MSYSWGRSVSIEKPRDKRLPYKLVDRYESYIIKAQNPSQNASKAQLKNSRFSKGKLNVTKSPKNFNKNIPWRSWLSGFFVQLFDFFSLTLYCIVKDWIQTQVSQGEGNHV